MPKLLISRLRFVPRLRRSQKKQAERKHVEDIQFEIGDWVLVSRATRKQHKLQLQWIGPYQIVDIRNRFVYRVRSIINDQELDVHAARIQLFSDGDLDFTASEDSAADYLRNTKGFTPYCREVYFLAMELADCKIRTSLPLVGIRLLVRNLDEL